MIKTEESNSNIGKIHEIFSAGSSYFAKFTLSVIRKRHCSAISRPKFSICKHFESGVEEAYNSFVPAKLLSQGWKPIKRVVTFLFPTQPVFIICLGAKNYSEMGASALLRATGA